MADIPQIDGYADLVRVARGGFAVVYRARQDRFDRVVALKVLSIDEIDERAQRRFERECRVMGSLSWHPNVVAVLDSGVSDGHPWLAMEFLDAGALSNRLERDGPLPWAEVVDIGVQVAGALGAAHSSGVLHRDLKPENLLVGPFGEAKLADFGIAAVEGGTRTTTGSASFTVSHVAPEILEGRPPDERSDLYGLASTLHTLITGSPPLVSQADESVAALITRILHRPAPRLTDVPGDLADVIEAGLAKSPEARPQSARAFGESLQAVQARSGQIPTALRLAPTSTATSPPTTPVGGPDATVARPIEAAVPAAAAAAPADPTAGDPRSGGRSRIGRWVAVAVGVAAGAGGIAMVASRSGTSEEAFPPSVEATIAVGADPRDLVVADGAVWVTTYEDNSVDRIDPATDDSATTDAQDNGPQGISSNDDGVWVGNYSDGTLTRIDPDSGETTDTVELGGSVQDVAATDGAVWAALLDDEVVRFDVGTGEVGQPITVGAGPQSIAADDTAVWVTSVVDDELTRIDPETGAVEATIPVDGGPFGVAVGFDAVWVVTGEGTMHRVDPETDEVTDTVDVGGSIWGIVVAEGAIWATDNAANSVIRVDPGTFEVTDTVPVGGSPLGIATGADALWVANADDDTVTRIDPGSG